MTKYKIHAYKSEIEGYEVTRETDKSVWYTTKDYVGNPYETCERKEGKWFDTAQEAKDVLVERLQRKVDIAKRRLQHARSELGMAKSIKTGEKK